MRIFKIRIARVTCRFHKRYMKTQGGWRRIVENGYWINARFRCIAHLDLEHSLYERME